MYELEKLRENLESKSLEVVLMYDLACILSTHLKVSIMAPSMFISEALAMLLQFDCIWQDLYQRPEKKGMTEPSHVHYFVSP